MCGAIIDVRESFCFSCADAQSIIGTGVDMYDKSFDGTQHEEGFGPVLPVQYTNDRLKLLIKNGWRPPLKDKEENSNRQPTAHI